MKELIKTTDQQCLAREFAINIKFSLEHTLPVEYKGVSFIDKLLINFNIHPVKSCCAGTPMCRDYFTCLRN